MARTCGNSSTKKRSTKGPKEAASALNRARHKNPPSLPPPNQFVAFSIATEATTPSSPLLPRRIKKKAKAFKLIKDASDLSSADTFPSGPNLPLPKSPLGSLLKSKGSPSVAIAGADTTPAQPSSPVASPISPPLNPKPSSLKVKDKGKAIGFPLRYSHENSYSNYFFDF